MFTVSLQKLKCTISPSGAIWKAKKEVVQFVLLPYISDELVSYRISLEKSCFCPLSLFSILIKTIERGGIVSGRSFIKILDEDLIRNQFVCELDHRVHNFFVAKKIIIITFTEII